MEMVDKLLLAFFNKLHTQAKIVNLNQEKDANLSDKIYPFDKPKN